MARKKKTTTAKTRTKKRATKKQQSRTTVTKPPSRTVTKSEELPAPAPARPSVVMYTDAPERLDYYESEPTKHEQDKGQFAGNTIRKITVSEEGITSERLQEIAEYQADRYRDVLYEVMSEEEFAERFA